MYKHTITITLDDDVVHRYSIMEWEALLLRTTAIHQDELPLSYGRIAEVLAEEYHKYGAAYFNHEYGPLSTHNTDGSLVKETIDTTYTNEYGNTISTKIQPAPCTITSPHLDWLDEPNSLQIGVSRH